MKVNIAIPVFNGETSLPHVLQKVLQQFPHPKQVVVADDGSTDMSARIAAEQGVRLITHPRNLGLAETRNTLLRNCESDVLIYFDADAAPRPGCIDALISQFKDPKVVAVGGQGVESNCRSASSQWRARTTPQSHGNQVIDEDWMLMGLCVAFRTQALVQVGGFDAKFTEAGEDVDVSIRMRKNGGKLVYAPEAKVDHLPHGNLLDVTLQAYKHAKFASYALEKNGIHSTEYAMDSARCLFHHSMQDLKEFHLRQLGIGAVNFAARAAGIALGTLKASVEKYRTS